MSHDKALIVSIESVRVTHVDEQDRFLVETLGSGVFKILHVTLRTGYRDTPNVPTALALARKRGLLMRNLDLEHGSYFVSRMTITPTSGSGMARWRKRLFIDMARNASSPMDHFGLPIDRTVVVACKVGM